jgi:hypothetical protein
VLYDLTGGRLEPESAQARPGEQEIRAAARRLADARFLLDQDIELAVSQALAELPEE